MGDRPYDPVPIGRVLDDQTHRIGMGGAKEVGALFSSWARIVGPAVATHVEPASLRNGVLKLRADSPTWATEIGYLREDIRAQVNEALGSEVIKKIEIGAGKGTGVDSGASRDASGKSGPAPPTKPDPRPPADDPMTAFERAREAWSKRRGKRR